MQRNLSVFGHLNIVKDKIDFEPLVWSVVCLSNCVRVTGIDAHSTWSLQIILTRRIHAYIQATK